MTFGRTGLAVFALFVVSLGYGVVVPTLPTLAGGRDVIPESSLSLIFALYSTARIACQIPGGLATDRFGPVPMLRLALPLFAATLLGFVLSADPWVFLVLRGLEGAATGLVYPACFALALLDGDPAGGGRRLSTVAALGTSGLLLGPALGALLPDAPRLAVSVALAPTVGLALWIWRPGGARVSPTAVGTRNPPRALREDVHALIQVGRQVAFLALMAPIAFNKLTFSAFQGLLPLVGADHWPGEPRRVLALFVLIGLVFALAQPVAGLLADRLAPRALVRWTTPALLGALAGLGFVNDFPPFALLFGLYVFASSIIFTATMKHGARTFGTEDTYGGVFGLLATLTDLATIIGPLVFINLYAAWNDGAFLAMAIVGLGFAVFHARRAP